MTLYDAMSLSGLGMVDWGEEEKRSADQSGGSMNDGSKQRCGICMWCPSKGGTEGEEK